MLELQHLTLTHGTHTLIEDLNFRFEDGAIYGLQAPSGRGKTTLCRAIAGHHSPRSGKVILDGKDITGRPGRNVILVNQDSDLFPWQRAGEAISFVKDPDESTERWLEFASLTERRNHYTKELSGGMKKRLSLARALSSHPKVLILDEVFSSQDFQLQQDIFQKTADVITSSHAILIIVSHDENFLHRSCQKILTL